MDSEFWKELRIVIQSEVERKLRGYRQISFDLEEEIVAEVLLNAHQKFATDGIRNPSRLRLHAENHVINAIRKIKRLYYRDWNVLDFLVDELSTTIGKNVGQHLSKRFALFQRGVNTEQCRSSYILYISENAAQ